MAGDSGSGYRGTGFDEALSEKARQAVLLHRMRAAIAVLAGVFFLVWTAMDGMSLYPRLPERIPTHFGWGGAPDGWGAKGVLSVYGLLITGAGVLAPAVAAVGAAVVGILAAHARLRAIEEGE